MKIFSMKTLRNLRSDCSGVIAAETAIIAVGVFFTIPMLIDITNTINSGLTLSSSLRAGTQIALVQPSNTTAIQEAVQVSSGFSQDDVMVTTETFCECNGSEVSCGTTSCGADVTPSTYMELTAHYDTPTFYTYPDPNPFAITRSTTIRVR